MQKLGEASKHFTPSKTFAAAPSVTDFFFYQVHACLFLYASNINFFIKTTVSLHLMKLITQP
jgi:hypothetical protein